MVTRYAVRMKNGDYMKQEWDGSLDRVRLDSVDHPVDSDLLRNREIAQRCIDEVLSGNTNLLVLYDDDNPPKEVVKLEIDYQFK